MNHQGFRYDFTMKELFYFILGKKTCPRCSGKLTREKTYETQEGSAFNDPFFIQHAKYKHYVYIYHCSKCGSQFTLNELTNKKER